MAYNCYRYVYTARLFWNVMYVMCVKKAKLVWSSAATAPGDG